ncbi:MAG: hypothetical protein GX956_00250 [Firmicutes bacterium]|mgnify:CR=1 FL=1|nr:hypothetical protein [Bacillota bacterium]
MANGRGVMMAGIMGLAVGVLVGNTMKRGLVTRQVRSTGRTLMKRARGTMGQRIVSWMD